MFPALSVVRRSYCMQQKNRFYRAPDPLNETILSQDKAWWMNAPFDSVWCAPSQHSAERALNNCRVVYTTLCKVVYSGFVVERVWERNHRRETTRGTPYLVAGFCRHCVPQERGVSFVVGGRVWNVELMQSLQRGKICEQPKSKRTPNSAPLLAVSSVTRVHNSHRTMGINGAVSLSWYRWFLEKTGIRGLQGSTP